ncbi:MAG: VTT domain-containing protein [Anaerolineales bacterium]|nr:VTT domain-containing protein [Anaerolineales bacterium]
MNIPKLITYKSRILNILCVAAALICIWHWRTPLGEWVAMIGDREAIVAYLQPYQGWGPFVLALILGSQVFFAFIPGHAFIVAGGYVYGFVVGTLITQVSTVLASQLAYLLARKAGRPFVSRMAPAHVIDKWNELAEKQGPLFFFFSFILPIFPNDLMCFIAGLSSIEPKKFFAANFFGRLPCAVFITLIGSHGVEMPLYFWVVILIAMIGLCISWKHISKQLEQRFLSSAQPVPC